MPNSGPHAPLSSPSDKPSGTVDGRSSIHEAQVPFGLTECRLDQAAAELFPEFSRAKLQQWIKDGSLRVNGAIAKPKLRLSGGENLRLLATAEPQGEWHAEPIALNIVFEDDQFLVISKPPGLVVHPAAGNYSGTLLNGLLHHRPSQATLPRAGIVHRLDKDTSGLMVVAKTSVAQKSLVAQLQARSVKREYEAIILGEVLHAGSVDAPIGRHPSQRTKMAVTRTGKPAVTHFEPIAQFEGFTHVRLRLETGRTHQIRVHMAHLGLPLVGDPVYGRSLPAKLLRERPELAALAVFPRQALHAKKLALNHPETAVRCEWQIPLANDMTVLLGALSGTSNE